MRLLDGIARGEKGLVDQFVYQSKCTSCFWDLKTMKRVKRLTKADVEGVKTIGFTADGKYVVSAYNYSPFLISIETGENTQIPIKTKATPLKMQSIKNNQVAISLGPLEDDNAISHTARPSQTGDLIAIGRGWYGKPEFVDLWDNASGKRIGRYKSDEGGVFAIFSYDNSLLAVQNPNALTIWIVSKGRRLGTMKCSGPAEFSPRVKELTLTCGTKLLLYGW